MPPYRSTHTHLELVLFKTFRPRRFAGENWRAFCSVLLCSIPNAWGFAGPNTGRLMSPTGEDGLITCTATACEPILCVLLALCIFTLMNSLQCLTCLRAPSPWASPSPGGRRRSPRHMPPFCMWLKTAFARVTQETRETSSFVTCLHLLIVAHSPSVWVLAILIRDDVRTAESI